MVTAIIMKTTFIKTLLTVSIVAVLILPLHTFLFTIPSFTRALINTADHRAVEIAGYMAQVLHKSGSTYEDDVMTARFRKEVRTFQEEFGLQKVKVFSSTGTIIYSTDDKEIGTINREAYFTNEVAKGKTYTEVVKKNQQSLEGQTYTADVVETYVPIMREGKFIAAFEIYHEITPEIKEIHGIMLSSGVTILLIVCFLLVVIVVVSLKAHKAISEHNRLEELLKDKTVEQEIILSNAPVGISLSRDGEIVWLNSRMADIFGFKKGDMESNDLKQSHPSQERYEKFRQEAYAVLATGQPYYSEELRKRKDATLFWCTVIGNALDPQNIAKGVIWIYRDITERKRAEAERERLISELKQALLEVKKLSGFLPICASCKKIRDDRGYWQQIETYIREHSEAEFSHGICPDCMKIHYPDYCDD